MACRKAWQLALTCWCGLCAVEQNSHASPAATSSDQERKQLLGRVEIALLGDVQQDPVLFERIRSLFPAETALVERDADHIDQRAVLLPERADTVYIWIRLTERTSARVYLALSDEAGRARYLFREVRLDAGLDEVGGETLAEVAHSSAQALWLRESQTPRQTLVAALEREEAPRSAAPSAPATAIGPVSAHEPPDSLPPATRRAQAKASTLRLGVGASETVHASGAEGWLHEPGAFLSFEYRTHLSLRAFARYLVPAELDLLPARVSLSGLSGEARAGWVSHDAARMRVRLEAGLGVLWGQAQASIVVDQPQAHPLARQDFERVYALASALF